MATPAFAYLIGHSAKNRLLSRLRRAKNPRYALAMIIGAAYLWLVYLRPQSTARSPSPLGPGAGNEVWMILATVFVLLMAALAWFMEGGPPSLALDESETFFILPAPVSRRSLVGYKVLRAQLGVLLSVVIWSVLFRRNTQPIDGPLRAIGLWIFFTTTGLHAMGAAIVHGAWAAAGKGALRKHWAATLALVTMIIGLAISLGLEHAAIVAAVHTGAREGFRAMAHALDTGPAGVLLWPIHAMLGPVLAQSNFAWLTAAPSAILVLAVHALWVATADDAGIESAVDRGSEKMSRVRRTRLDRSTSVATELRPRVGVVLKTMPLSSLGWPGVAIIWKNVLCMRRKARPTLLVTMSLLPIGIGGITAANESPAAGAVVAALGVAIMLLLFGPLMVRSDLRHDMLNLVALKLMPMRGRTIVAAEVLSVVVPLGAVQAGAVVIAALAALMIDSPPFGPIETLILLVAAIPVIIVFNAAFVTIQNAAPVLFPGWAKLGVVTGGGMEAIGQMVIVLVIMGGLLGLMLMVPALVAAGIIFVGRSQLAISAAIGLVAGGALLAAEVAGLMSYLGGALERTEPSDLAAA